MLLLFLRRARNPPLSRCSQPEPWAAQRDRRAPRVLELGELLYPHMTWWSPCRGPCFLHLPSRDFPERGRDQLQSLFLQTPPHAAEQSDAEGWPGSLLLPGTVSGPPVSSLSGLPEPTSPAVCSALPCRPLRAAGPAQGQLPGSSSEGAGQIKPDAASKGAAGAVRVSRRGEAL